MSSQSQVNWSKVPEMKSLKNELSTIAGQERLKQYHLNGIKRFTQELSYATNANERVNLQSRIKKLYAAADQADFKIEKLREQGITEGGRKRRVRKTIKRRNTRRNRSRRNH